MYRRGWRRALSAAAGAALLSGVFACGAAADPAPTPGAPPALVVVIVVDMFPAGKLEALRPLLSGGLRRMLEAGRVWPACAHAHAATVTAAGHASLLSGLLPSKHGIIMNEWYDREEHREVYCVEAPAGDPAASRSSRYLRSDGLADLIKRANPASKVYAVGAKDRSAILSAGHQSDGAFWFDRDAGTFRGFPGAVARLAAWKDAFFEVKPGVVAETLGAVPAAWNYPVRREARPDDSRYEMSPRAAPHSLRSAAGTTGPEAARQQARRVEESPWMDWLTLELAGRLLAEEGLGRDAAPDLLVVAVAAADFVGHDYGPDSQEYLDTIIRLDGWLTDFMKRAEAAASAPGGAVFVLTSDHGVLPIPETRPGARRVDSAAMLARVQSMLTARLAPDAAAPFIETVKGAHIYLDRRALAARGIPLEKAVEETRGILLELPEVARVYRASELAAGEGGDPDLELYRASWYPDRGGDLVVQPRREYLITSRAYGTSHGTPYDYDRLVPLILMGRGIAPGESSAACRTVDLAPTLAKLLGLSFATPRDGQPLPLTAEKP